MLRLPEGNLYIPIPDSDSKRHYNKGVKEYKLSLKMGSLFVWKSQQWEELRQKRQKRRQNFSSWLLAPSPRGFFCLRKLHKFNNSIVRNYFPPHYESFVKRLNFHLPAVAFQENSTVCVCVCGTRAWWLSQPWSVEAAGIVSTSINTHLLATENATSEINFT